MSDIYLSGARFLDEETLDAIRGSAIPIREMARQSGVPYSTLQNIVANRSVVPTERTQALLDNWVAAGPTFTVRKGPVWHTDTDRWSDSKLANLRPPSGATNFRLVVRSPGTPTGWTSTPYDELRSTSPYDQAFELNIDPRSIGRVVWARATGFGRAT